jgi:putative protease
LGDRRYLLSPQDLASLELLPEIVAAGVASIKIEGRLKAPEYVAAITGLYRRGLDRIGGQSQPRSAPRGSPADRYAMEMAFSRGLYTGWFRGVNNQRLVHGRFGKKRGVYLGRVTRAAGDRVWVRLEAPVKAGDGLVFDAGRPHEQEQGGRVYSVGPVGGARTNPDETPLTFGKDDLDLRRIRVGDRVWKTSDPELERRVRQTYIGQGPKFQRPICITAHGHAGASLVIEACDDEGNVARVASSMPLAAAERQPLTSKRLAGQLGRLGGTPFRLGSLECRIEDPVILPVSEINRLRRELVARLEELRIQPKRWTLHGTNPASLIPESGALEPGERHLSVHGAVTAGPSGEAELVVLVRSLIQMEAALQAGCGTLYGEFEDPRFYREAVARVREFSARSDRHSKSLPKPSLWVAPPRIFKMGEDWVLKQVRSSEADGYLVRNPDHISAFADSRRIGDFSLNVANPLAVDQFIRRCGLERVTASYDLNADQLVNLLRQVPPEWIEITLHQHMPMFHMEHCLFCAFLSKGTDYTNCGRPCDKHRVALQDRVGARHPVLADAGCRNTVFNALAQTGAESAHRLLALGARRFRIEFLDESPECVLRTIGMYRRLLRGELAGSQLWRDLKLISRLGVTRGQMEKADASVPRFGEIEW